MTEEGNMRKLLIIGGVLVVGVVGLALASAARGPQRGVSATQQFQCLDMGGTVSVEGSTPSVICSTDSSGAHLQVTAIATPLPAPPSPAPGNTTTSSSSSVNVNVSQSRTQTAHSGSVTIDGRTVTGEGGSVSNNSSSTTSVVITNH